MPDFEGSETFTLRPTDAKVPLRFLFAACSTSTSNDGSFPYGMQIASAVVDIYDDAGATATGIIVASATTWTTAAVITAMSHPGGSAFGGVRKYTAVVALTMNNAASAVINYECARIMIDGARP